MSMNENITPQFMHAPKNYRWSKGEKLKRKIRDLTSFAQKYNIRGRPACAYADKQKKVSWAGKECKTFV